ncbi:hypothetical protein B0H16DRAFT_1733812 [Mycena metata]|uniref:Uncharacterized protein n=1 Tax=Mycena metata TaxID=1033252 RepID=A0AAD7HYI7_9AGAR|nr:hypothetical protein B0H16DRAFT_1733812 [Mycena metata]
MLPLPPLHPPESLTNPSPQIFFADPHGSWRWADARHKRPMGSIVLDPGVKEMLLGNARDFLASEKVFIVGSFGSWGVCEKGRRAEETGRCGLWGSASEGARVYRSAVFEGGGEYLGRRAAGRDEWEPHVELWVELETSRETLIRRGSGPTRGK